MKLLLSGFIIDIMKWFFSTYSKFTISFMPPGYIVSSYATYKFLSVEQPSTNVVKFYFTSPCTVNFDFGTPSTTYFNPNVDCASPSSFDFSNTTPSYVKYAVAPANQTTFVVQIKAPPDIT